MKFRHEAQADRVEMNMTPMIDVCFQLIIFFMLSLRLFSAEGDFSIAMPVAAPRQGLPPPDQKLPIKVRMLSDRDGNLTAIEMGQRIVPSFKALREQIKEMTKMDRGPGATGKSAEVELDLDYNLRFEFVVDALTAVAGFFENDKQTIVRMVDKIRFTPPRRPEQ